MQVQLLGRAFQAGAGQPDQGLAGGGGGLADLHAALGHAGGAGGGALVGGQQGVALDQGDGLDGDAQLLGGHLGDGDAQALAQIDLAAIQGHPAIGADGQEAVDLGGIHRLGGGLGRAGQGEGHHQGGGGAEQGAA